MNVKDRFERTKLSLAAAAADHEAAEAAFKAAQESHSRAEEAFEEAVTEATSFYASRLQRRKDLIATVINKHNFGRPYNEVLIPSGYDWALKPGYVEVVRLAEDKITFYLRLQGQAKSDAPKLTLNRDVIHLSDRQLAAAVRKRLKAARQAEADRKQAEHLRTLKAECKKAEDSILAEERKLARLKREQERRTRQLDALTVKTEVPA